MNKSFGEDDELLKMPWEGEAILDGHLIEVRMFDEGYYRTVVLKILPRPDTITGILELTFKEVTGVEFANDGEVPLYITSYKFIKTKDGQYYLSLDPYLEDGKEDDRDGDVVISKHMSGRLI